MPPVQSRPHWHDVQVQLRRWHQEGDRDSLRSALRFIEGELRNALPAAVKRGLPLADQDDAINSMLKRLIEQPLPEELDDLHSYLMAIFRNHCLDMGRKARRMAGRDAAFCEEWPVHQPRGRTPEEELASARISRAINAAFEKLPIEDRVAAKLDLAPERLTPGELAWISGRLAVTPEDAATAIRHATDKYELTKIFDPGTDDPTDMDARRRRLDRFLKRVNRASQKLKAALRDMR